MSSYVVQTCYILKNISVAFFLCPILTMVGGIKCFLLVCESVHLYICPHLTLTLFKLNNFDQISMKLGHHVKDLNFSILNMVYIALCLQELL